jgi:hypothetical protein
MSKTIDTSHDSQALPAGFTAVRTYTQLGRDLVALWLGAADQIIRLSVETNETAIEAVRARFGRSAVPATSDVWNWWANAAAGLLGAYTETLQTPPAAPPPYPTSENAEAAIEVDVTETKTGAAPPTRERAAAAEVAAPKVTASTAPRRK